MAKKKMIAVVGATGAQGGGLVRAILEDPAGEFGVRALTRDPASDAARALAARGAEVVAADVDDADSIARAFEGASAAFCVTFVWAHFSPEKEMEQARTLARAAAAAGVEHAVWSTLEDTRRFMALDDARMPTLQGKYKVPHFDAKGASNVFFAEAGVPTTYLHTSFYWENFLLLGRAPKRGPDGKLAIALPMGDRKLPGIAAEDIGKCALGVFRMGAELHGKNVGIAGEHLTGAQMAAALGRALGLEIAYHAVPPDVFRGFGFPGADDLGNMFQFKHDFEADYCGLRDLALARALHPGLLTFDAWLAGNKDHIPLG